MNPTPTQSAQASGALTDVQEAETLEQPNELETVPNVTEATKPFNVSMADVIVHCASDFNRGYHAGYQAAYHDGFKAGIQRARELLDEWYAKQPKPLDEKIAEVRGGK